MKMNTSMTRDEVVSERKKRGETLRALRKQKKISQVKMMQLSGLSLPTIIRIETGKREWRIDSEIMYMKAISAIIA
jgi:transcriptional regulator with XRE-family HTH domain